MRDKLKKTVATVALASALTALPSVAFAEGSHEHQVASTSGSIAGLTCAGLTAPFMWSTAPMLVRFGCSCVFVAGPFGTAPMLVCFGPDGRTIVTGLSRNDVSRISREEARPKAPPHGEIPEVKDGKADCPPGQRD